jgi:WD40 repeat protein
MQNSYITSTRLDISYIIGKIWRIHNVIGIKNLYHRVFSIAFSSDGKYLASGSADHMVKL